jgi:hypothetical protein
MFLDQVKKNWKKYQNLTLAVLMISFIRTYGELRLGWAPLDYIGVFKLSLMAIASFAALAFLKAALALGIAYYRQLCSFLAALRAFSRNYWSSKTTAV